MDKIIIANWKMNPETREEAIKLAKESDVEGLIIAPPYVFLEDVADNIKKAELGAQDLFWDKQGAFTGEISAPELKSFGVKYVIIGHSERRRILGETDEMIAHKIKAAIDNGLTPILCVGESAEERASGKTNDVISRQLGSGLSLLQPTTYNLQPIIIAYEPIWAIGTGTPDTPQDMINMVQYIKGVVEKISITDHQLPISVIYGGSVTSENAEEFLKQKEIDGVLVGGASLKPEDITKIVKIGKQI